MASNISSKPSLNKSNSEDDDKSPSKSEPQEDDQTNSEEYDIFKYCYFDGQNNSDPEEDDDNNYFEEYPDRSKPYEDESFAKVSTKNIIGEKVSMKTEADKKSKPYEDESFAKDSTKNIIGEKVSMKTEADKKNNPYKGLSKGFTKNKSGAKVSDKERVRSAIRTKQSLGLNKDLNKNNSGANVSIKNPDKPAKSEYESVYEEHDTSSDGFENVKLGYGITITLPKARLTEVKNMHFKPWSHERRDGSLSDVDGLNTYMVSTDVYELSIETKTSGSTVRGIQDIHCMTIRVPLENIEKGKWFNYRSHILYDKKWTWTKATYFEDEGLQYVYFDTYILESFYITRSPSHEKFTVDEEGNTFTWSKDDRIQVQFPKGSVDTKEEVQVVVYPIDRVGMEWRLQNTPQNCNILAMSDCLYVKSNVQKFNQQVSVQLPIDKTVEEECELVFIHWKGNKVQNIEYSSDRKIEKVNDCYTISVDSFSGNQIAITRRGSKGKISDVEIELNCGKIKQCKFLVFVKKENPTMLSARIAIVQIEKIKEAKSRASELQMKEISFCRSADAFLYDKERIKIDISGNVNIVHSTVKHVYILKFLHCANDCFLDILLQIYKRMDQVPYTQIHLTKVGKEKCLLHSTHFDPDRVKLISRRQTMIPESPSDYSRSIQPSQNQVYSDPTRPPSEDHLQPYQSRSPDNKVPSDPTRPPSEEHLLPNQSRSPDNKVPSDPTRPPSEEHPPSNEIGTPDNKVPSDPTRPPSEEHLLPNQSRSPDNKDFYSEKSMIWLAKHLPAKDAYEFGIHLGLKEEDINRLKMSTNNDIIQYHMGILKSWKDSEKSANKIVVLINALKYCDLNNIAHDVEKSYKKGKMLNKDDFK